MVEPALARRMVPDEFLAWEREQDARHLYVRGEVFAMAGGSPRHSLLSARVIARLGAGLQGKPCDVHTTDLRLGVGEDHFVYADAVVASRPLTFRAGTTDVVTNPVIVVEVLSKSTESCDRGDKLAAYLDVASVHDVVLVSQRTPRVEVYTRDVGSSPSSFRYQVFGSGAVVLLPRIDGRLDVDALYEGAFELPGE